MTSNEKYLGYVGTYTKGESEGIYCFSLDTQTEKIAIETVAARLENPTYLSVSENKQFLYSVVKEGESGGVASFSVDSKTGGLTPQNTQVAPGSPPCYVSVSQDNKHVFSANYHKGTITSYLVNEKDGSIFPPASVIEHKGSGPDPRQEKPHTHYAAFTPDQKYVVAVELGSDQLMTYTVDAEGKLTELQKLSMPAGSGPRHITFHPHSSFAYVMTEFSSEVIVLTYDAASGRFNIVQKISTIPDTFTENNQGSAIHISSDGRFVYAGNRGHNSIAVFKVDNITHELSLVERVSTEGDWPRDFVLDPTENYVVASNQNSSNLVLFRRNQDNGKLRVIHSDVNVPDPVCVKFL